MTVAPHLSMNSSSALDVTTSCLSWSATLSTPVTLPPELRWKLHSAISQYFLQLRMRGRGRETKHAGAEDGAGRLDGHNTIIPSLLWKSRSLLGKPESLLNWHTMSWCAPVAVAFAVRRAGHVGAVALLLHVRLGVHRVPAHALAELRVPVAAACEQQKLEC